MFQYAEEYDIESSSNDKNSVQSVTLIQKDIFDHKCPFCGSSAKIKNKTEKKVFDYFANLSDDAKGKAPFDRMNENIPQNVPCKIIIKRNRYQCRNPKCSGIKEGSISTTFYLGAPLDDEETKKNTAISDDYKMAIIRYIMLSGSSEIEDDIKQIFGKIIPFDTNVNIGKHVAGVFEISTSTVNSIVAEYFNGGIKEIASSITREPVSINKSTSLFIFTIKYDGIQRRVIVYGDPGPDELNKKNLLYITDSCDLEKTKSILMGLFSKKKAKQISRVFCNADSILIDSLYKLFPNAIISISPNELYDYL